MSRAAKVGVLAVRGYQLAVSPLLSLLAAGGLGLGGCRFHPSCSAYAVAAIERDGLRRGSARALRRLARCHPFHLRGQGQRGLGGLDLP